jgi:hypothetical protein
MTVVNVSITQSEPTVLGQPLDAPTLAGQTSSVVFGGRVDFTDLRIDKIGKHKIAFTAVSGARASLQKASEDGDSMAFGGVGEKFGHAPNIITVTTWIIVRPSAGFKLQVVQEAWPGVQMGKATAGASGNPFAQQPGVIVTDAGGNRISDDSAAARSSITAALLRSPCSPLPACCGGNFEDCVSAFGTSGLIGNVYGQMVNGGILFTDLSVSLLGTYSIVFYSTSSTGQLLPDVSATQLEIIAGIAPQILILRQPSDVLRVLAGDIFDTSAAIADDGESLSQLHL